VCATLRTCAASGWAQATIPLAPVGVGRWARPCDAPGHPGRHHYNAGSGSTLFVSYGESLIG
jgi:hypothetical protein